MFSHHYETSIITYISTFFIICYLLSTIVSYMTIMIIDIQIMNWRLIVIMMIYIIDLIICLLIFISC